MRLTFGFFIVQVTITCTGPGSKAAALAGCVNIGELHWRSQNT